MPDKIAKFIASLDEKTRNRLKQRLTQLKKDPFKNDLDIKKLRGNKDNHYRLRLGKIRIIFQLQEKEVTIIDIDFRGNIY